MNWSRNYGNRIDSGIGHTIAEIECPVKMIDRNVSGIISSFCIDFE
jgi:hypothetical protein